MRHDSDLHCGGHGRSVVVVGEHDVVSFVLGEFALERARVNHFGGHGSRKLVDVQPEIFGVVVGLRFGGGQAQLVVRLAHLHLVSVGYDDGERLELAVLSECHLIFAGFGFDVALEHILGHVVVLALALDREHGSEADFAHSRNVERDAVAFKRDVVLDLGNFDCESRPHAFVGAVNRVRALFLFNLGVVDHVVGDGHSRSVMRVSLVDNRKAAFNTRLEVVPQLVGAGFYRSQRRGNDNLLLERGLIDVHDEFGGCALVGASDRVGADYVLYRARIDVFGLDFHARAAGVYHEVLRVVVLLRQIARQRNAVAFVLRRDKINGGFFVDVYVQRSRSVFVGAGNAVGAVCRLYRACVDILGLDLDVVAVNLNREARRVVVTLNFIAL